jgi:hypothetical protein
METIRDNFRNGYFWEYYLDLERQFIDFTKYVPYLEGNENVYSFRLLNLTLAIGAHIDSAFKEMFRFPDFSKKYPEILKKVKAQKATIRDYLSIGKEYCLSERKVFFKKLPKNEVVFPFKQFETGASPEWWTTYNKIKHEFSSNFEKSTLKNARDALAGAFLLNVVHKPAILRLFEYGVAKPKYESWSVEEGDIGVFMEPHIKVLQNILRDSNCPPLYITTNLFYFDYERPDNR